MSFIEKIKSFVTGEKIEEKKEEKRSEELKALKPDIEAKYANNECALCGKTGAEKKWAGQYWHKKCFRSLRGKAKGMI